MENLDGRMQCMCECSVYEEFYIVDYMKGLIVVDQKFWFLRNCKEEGDMFVYKYVVYIVLFYYKVCCILCFVSYRVFYEELYDC